jgi:hypothetical protein
MAESTDSVLRPTRYLAFLAMAVYITISALVSVRKEWFGSIYSLPGRDHLAHFFGAGLLSSFMVLGITSLATRRRPSGSLATLAAAALLVTLNEVFQLAIPSRVFDLHDLAWSLAGVAAFGLSAAGIDRFRRLRRRYDDAAGRGSRLHWHGETNRER